MSYQGWLLKAGNTIIPNRLISVGTYHVIPKQRQDLDPFTDLNGYLHRQVVENKPSKLTFELAVMKDAGGVSGKDMDTFVSIMKGNFTSSEERKFHCTFWNPFDRGYSDEDMYMVNPEFTINSIIHGEILYDPTTITFIGY